MTAPAASKCTQSTMWASWDDNRLGLVLSINVIHCGNEVRNSTTGSDGLRDTVDFTELASRRRGVSFRALWGTHTSPKITSVTCGNVLMVTMDDCVHVVGLAGRCLGPEEPTKLVPAWVILAVSLL